MRRNINNVEVVSNIGYVRHIYGQKKRKAPRIAAHMYGITNVVFDSIGENGKKAGLEAYNGTFGSLFITFFLEMLKEEKPLSLSHNLYVCTFWM